MRVAHLMVVVLFASACVERALEIPEDVSNAPPGQSAIQISSRTDFTCAVLADGTGRCWGVNTHGELGDGTITTSSTPTQVRIAKIAAIETGYTHACALDPDGAVWCWGNSFDDGSNPDQPTPFSIHGGAARALAVGGNASCLIAADDGSISCWGQENVYLGISNNTETPQPLTGLGAVETMGIGDDFACGYAAGTVKCVGLNEYGMLGDGTTNASATPMTVVNDVLSLAVGGEAACVVTKSRGAQCWGFDPNGMLGDGMMTSFVSTPTDVVGLTNVDKVVAGIFSACAILVDKTVRCWGANGDGQLGDGTTMDSTHPVAVAGLSGAKDIAIGKSHTCALLEDGTVKCWGANDVGQLGDGTTTERHTPTTVPL